ncbi:hypothetical protein BHM03_00011204 [Ensete ventricosum]|nr:hypothetical protein BHM03_00011204 [Ensete ventricosum]
MGTAHTGWYVQIPQQTGMRTTHYRIVPPTGAVFALLSPEIDWFGPISDYRAPLSSPRFAISTCTARYERYIPVRQFTGTRTARYWAVPSKIDRRRPIEEEIDRRRLREKSIVGGRLRKKKGRRRGKEKKKKRGRKNTSPARRPRPLAVAARGRAAFSPA